MAVPLGRRQAKATRPNARWARVLVILLVLAKERKYSHARAMGVGNGYRGGRGERCASFVWEKRREFCEREEGATPLPGILLWAAD